MYSLIHNLDILHKNSLAYYKYKLTSYLKKVAMHINKLNAMEMSQI